MNENVWERQELLFKIKLLKDRVEAFESGEKYVQMEKLHKVARAGDFRTIQHLKKELAQERAEKVHVRELWYATCLDIQNECDYKLKEKEKECAKKLAEKDQVILLLQKDLQDAREQQEAEHEKYLNQLKEAYDAKTQLEEEKEKNQELLARIHKDYSNSSKSSSMPPDHKTIHNSRKDPVSNRVDSRAISITAVSTRTRQNPMRSLRRINIWTIRITFLQGKS